MLPAPWFVRAPRCHDCLCRVAPSVAEITCAPGYNSVRAIVARAGQRPAGGLALCKMFDPVRTMMRPPVSFGQKANGVAKVQTWLLAAPVLVVMTARCSGHS